MEKFTHIKTKFEKSQTPNKINVKYFGNNSQGKDQIIQEFPDSSDFLVAHELCHQHLNNYFGFDCPLNSPQEEAITVAMQLYYSVEFRRDFANYSGISNLGLREIFAKVIDSYLIQNEKQKLPKIMEIFDLCTDFATFLQRSGKIKNMVNFCDKKALQIIENLGQNTSLKTETKKEFSCDSIFKNQSFLEDFGDNQFLMAIYNKIQNKLDSVNGK